MEDHRTPQYDGSEANSKKAATSGSPTLETDDDHVPVPAPHVGGGPPRAYELFWRFQIDAGGEAWMSAKYPVDVEEVA